MKRVWVNGTFDVLHIGHIKLLKYASGFGSLRVGVDGDRRVKELKGQDRPYNNSADRVEFLESLKGVDSVVVFDSEQELINQIKEYGPDIMVIGSDYMNKRIIGAEFAEIVLFFHRIENKSTTEILEYAQTSSDR